MDMVALPFCDMALSAVKPKELAYPRELVTLGDHIRKRRLDLGMLQRDVAEILNADMATIMNWELNHTNPDIEFIPGILRFLGYDPRPAPVTFQDKIRWSRATLGWSQKTAAKFLKCDESNFAGWERGEHIPMRRTMEKLARLFQKAGI